jgi:hypothetical protein
MSTWTSYFICVGIPKREQSLRLDLPLSNTQFTNPTSSPPSSYPHPPIPLLCLIAHCPLCNIRTSPLSPLTSLFAPRASQPPPPLLQVRAPRRLERLLPRALARLVYRPRSSNYWECNQPLRRMAKLRESGLRDSFYSFYTSTIPPLPPSILIVTS